MLQEYLKDAVTKLDSQIEGKVAPAERMRRLLTAKDKKATLLEMAGQPAQPSSPLHAAPARVSHRCMCVWPAGAMMDRIVHADAGCAVQATTR